jgi:hypothetical protein
MSEEEYDEDAYNTEDNGVTPGGPTATSGPTRTNGSSINIDNKEGACNIF